MMRTLLLALLATLSFVPAAHAGGAPGTMTFSARLLDGTTPFSGDVTVQLDLYRSPESTGEPALWSETYQVTAVDGLISVRMGEQRPLTTTVFDGGDVYLETTIQQGGTPTTLAPRLAVGSVPYALRAAFAEDTAAVPTGAVMHFDLPACPPGWTALEGARGRAIVGGTPGGEPVGTPLGDREDRLHTHRTAAIEGLTSSTGAHNHGGATAATSVAHTHGIPALSGSTSSNWHVHRWARYDHGPKQWFSHSGDGNEQLIRDYGDGLNDNRGGGFPLATENFSAELFTSASTHNHTVTTAAGGTGGASDTAHAHGIGSDGAHVHGYAIPEHSSQAARTSDVIPYIQLLVCRKT